MKVKSDHSEECPHCIIADAANDFYESPGAASFVDTNRTENPEGCYPFSDEQLVTTGLLRGMAVVIIDLIFSEPDPRVRQHMLGQFHDASVTAQMIRDQERRGGLA